MEYRYTSTSMNVTIINGSDFIVGTYSEREKDGRVTYSRDHYPHLCSMTYQWYDMTIGAEDVMNNGVTGAEGGTLMWRGGGCEQLRMSHWAVSTFFSLEFQLAST